MVSQDYLSLVGKRADSPEVKQFFHKHQTSWSAVDIYKGRATTSASLELYDSALELEFVKRLSPKSEATQQAKDFILSSISIANHNASDDQVIGNIVGPIRLASRFDDIAKVLGKDYEENRYQGTCCWRYDGVTVEIDYETTQERINYILLSSNSPEIVAIKEVEENLSDGVLSRDESEDLGIEPPDLPYVDEPVTLDYDNVPVVERQPSGRVGIIALILALVATLTFFDDVVDQVSQIF